MPTEYTIELREDREIIIAKASGEWESQTDNMMNREIMQMIGVSGTRKVLVDIRDLHFDLPIIQIFERARDLRDQRLAQPTTSTKVAIVYPAANPKIEEDFKFFETVVRNRGLPYRAFKDMEDAMEWLTE